MKADEVDPQRAKFFERVYELLQATRESVVAVEDNGIYSTLSTFSEYLAQLVLVDKNANQGTV